MVTAVALLLLATCSGGDDAGVPVPDCEAGDFLACDLLLQLSSIGGELEGVAFTCGGRLEFVAVPDCRTVLGD